MILNCIGICSFCLVTQCKANSSACVPSCALSQLDLAPGPNNKTNLDKTSPEIVMDGFSVISSQSFFYFIRVPHLLEIFRKSKILNLISYLMAFSSAKALCNGIKSMIMTVNPLGPVH